MQVTIPRHISPTATVTAADYNRLVDALRVARISSGFGVEVDYTTSGTILRVPRRPDSGTTAIAKPERGYLQPFLTTTVGTSLSGGQADPHKPAWTVTAGYVNGVIPVSMRNYIAGAIPPKPGLTPTDPQNWAQEITGPGWLFVAASWELQGTLVKWTPNIEFRPSWNLDDYASLNTESTGYMLIGQIRQATDAQGAVIPGSYRLLALNNNHISVQTCSGGYDWYGSYVQISSSIDPVT